MCAVALCIGVKTVRYSENYGTLHPPLELEPSRKDTVFWILRDFLQFFGYRLDLVSDKRN